MNAPSDSIFFDAGVFIGALLRGDSRHTEARPLVEAARTGNVRACTTSGVLSEVYAALTWAGAKPPHQPHEAAHAIRLLVEPPSALQVLFDSLEAGLKMLVLAEHHQLTSRRIHDARHAAIAIVSGVQQVYTYDINDWKKFQMDGLTIIGPKSVLPIR
ncbi:MAG: type II toxin-antitoxin system VapC family toxin [bacterium]|nr:type II toxin-antitoxin system VapC family toxin [bacterium]